MNSRFCSYGLQIKMLLTDHLSLKLVNVFTNTNLSTKFTFTSQQQQKSFIGLKMQDCTCHQLEP